MGEENVPENALSRKFLDPSKRASGLFCRGFFLYRKNRALIPEGGWKTYRTRGRPNPFWEGCHSWGFPPPSFFHPPMASSEKISGFCENLRFQVLCFYPKNLFGLFLPSKSYFNFSGSLKQPQKIHCKTREDWPFSGLFFSIFGVIF